MIFQIRLAERVIEVHSLCSTVYSISKDYLIPADEYADPDISLIISDADILKELHEIRRVSHLQGVPTPIVGEGHCESLAVFRKIADAMPAFDTFLMHGAVVAKDGFAYMFTADSGVGKTTRAKLWIEQFPDSVIVNGDKPLIKITETEVLACGTPWCGKEGWNHNMMVPLKAIFLVERAEDSKDSVKEVSFEDAFSFILKQIHRPENSQAALKTIHLMRTLEDRVKIYKLCSKPQPEAIQMAYKIVTRKKENNYF